MKRLANFFDSLKIFFVFRSTVAEREALRLEDSQRTESQSAGRAGCPRRISHLSMEASGSIICFDFRRGCACLEMGCYPRAGASAAWDVVAAFASLSFNGQLTMDIGQ
jgi:hypothetical protein